MAHGQWTEVEARGILEALQRSGLGVEKFARSRGLTPQLRLDTDDGRLFNEYTTVARL